MITTTTHRDSVLLELKRSKQIILQWFLPEMNTKVGEKESVIRTISKQITPRSKVLVSKLLVPQLRKKFSAFFGPRKFIATFKTRSPVFSNTICPCPSFNLRDKILVHTKQAKLHVCILYFCLHIPREKMEPYKILNLMVAQILPTLYVRECKSEEKCSLHEVIKI